ncbi:MAG TPA: SPFH domain-containing protein [Ferruginibacter sp.]|nr:SPFH domain-containing protein [Ferruginibacter sp.]HMX36869.1 SPFH domain-containing protein [Ferruginibacter sp.]HNJ28053.1 SPFH domain-containing protein [Ferruginibacter sp.]HNJ96320.1 SPFH domain-containing protein [Ferruginibacter sp.]HNL65675.1 SPFH domain-containing protein [Ferruginibacter sp.]
MIAAILFLLVFFIVALIIGAFRKKNYVTEEGRFRLAGMIRPVAAFIITIILVAVNPVNVERIDAGHVGIKVSNVGDDRGVGRTEYVTGWVFYNSWISRIYEFPIHQQHIDYEANDIVTKGGFRATIKPSFNYSINPGNVADMFQNLRVGVTEMEQGWLKNAIVGSVNDVANRYTVDSIFNHREEFESDIVKECNKRVSKWFNVSQLRTNIVPPTEISESIVAKTRAIQEAQVAENRRQVAVADAERKIAEARGDSAQAVIQAAGRAEAIRREQLSLTPLYIDYIKIQKWSGQVPTTVAGNSGLMIQLPKDSKD